MKVKDNSHCYYGIRGGNTPAHLNRSAKAIVNKSPSKKITSHLPKHIAVDFELHGFISRCRNALLTLKYWAELETFSSRLFFPSPSNPPSITISSVLPWKTWWIMQVSDFWLSGSHKDQRRDFCLRQVMSVVPSLYLSLLNDFTS